MLQQARQQPNGRRPNISRPLFNTRKDGRPGFVRAGETHAPGNAQAELPRDRPPVRIACFLALLSPLLLSPPTHAQVTPAETSRVAAAAQLTRYDKNNNGVLDADELAAMQSDEAKSADAITTDLKASNDGAVQLTPFEVNTSKDDGFSAVNAGTATKLGLDLKDLAAPYSVMTGEFIEALGITNLQDATMWSTNSGPVIDSQGADQFAVPVMYNIRGVILNQGQQRNFFNTAGISDTYNAERIDFGRGPNAVLFNTGANSVLGGGISLQTKRARMDRNFETIGFTIGSWEYYRSTLDLNRKLSDKLAIRANAVWQDKGGYMDHEFEKIKGITVAGTYRLTQKTEIRVEGSNEKVARTRPTFPSFDRLSGWDGTTVFSGPITNAMLSSTATPGGMYGLTFNGEPQGIERVGNDYVYIPGQGTVMNWVHMARSRRGDSTPRVPMIAGRARRLTC